MKDSMTLILALLSAVPIVATLWGLWLEYSQFRKEKHAAFLKEKTREAKEAEYNKIVEVTKELELDFQTNTGISFPEEVYLNRSVFILKETSWYKLVNSI